jgi:hypothetical protein
MALSPVPLGIPGLPGTVAASLLVRSYGVARFGPILPGREFPPSGMLPSFDPGGPKLPEQVVVASKQLSLLIRTAGAMRIVSRIVLRIGAPLAGIFKVMRYQIAVARSITPVMVRRVTVSLNWISRSLKGASLQFMEEI